MVHRRIRVVLFSIRLYRLMPAFVLFLGVFGGSISAVFADDPVPETGMNAPSDAGRGTVAEVSATRPSRPVTESRVDESRLTEPLPVVRLTPKDILLPGEAWRGKLDLAGQWWFKFEVPPSFDGTLGSIPDWDQARVPGHFSWQGFPEMHKAFNVPVAWGRTFMLPESWAGLRVRLRFESADGLTRVWVNGKKVGESETVNTPSEFDITHVLKNGENQIVVTIEKTEATYWSKRTMGGLARGVYLQAVPPVSLARLHVTSDIKSVDPVGNEPTTADVISHIRVANDTDQKVEGYSVKFSLTDSGSKQIPIRLRSEKILLPPVEAGTMLQVSLPLPVDGVYPWSAEFPNLYYLTCQLIDPQGQLVMTVRQRFGFREIETREGKLYLNGTPIKWRGANYHMTYPGYGYFILPEQIRQDVRLFRFMNLNVLRSRPVPDSAYLDFCDEIGMYTTVEAMLTLMMYDAGPRKDHGADPSIASWLRSHVAGMIENTWSHPSIILYGLGNENPYYDYFREVASAMKSQDLGIPLFFGSDARNGVDIDFMDVNDDHYPRNGLWSADNLRKIEGRDWDYPKDRPNIFTEWCHIAALNIKEYKFDPGTDEFWGYLAELHANWTYDQPHVLGGFLFLGAPEVKIGARFPWRGFFDEWRRPYDMAWHVKKSHSPIRIHDTRLRAMDSGVGVWIENRYDFTNLNHLEMRWEQGSRRGVIRIDVPPQTRQCVILPLNDREPALLRFVDSHGAMVDVYRLKPVDNVQVQLPVSESIEPVIEKAADGTMVVKVGETRFGFDTGGLLTSADLKGVQILSGRPTVVVRPTQFINFRGNQKRTLVNQCVGWKADRVDVQLGKDRVTIISQGRYTMASGSIVTMIRSDGQVEISYKLIWEDPDEFNCFDWGFGLRVVSEANELRWIRHSLWSVYPADHIGRPQGSAIASGDPRYAAARLTFRSGHKPWPWSQDMIDGVTNDFRSTKFCLVTGGLFRSDGSGVQVLGKPGTTFIDSQHLRATPVGGNLDGEIFTREVFPEDTSGYWLEVLEYHAGSSEPHLTKSLRHYPLMIRKGTSLSGTVRFALTSFPLGVDESVNLVGLVP